MAKIALPFFFYKNTSIFIILLLLFCNSSIVSAAESDDILDIVMPSILASTHSSNIITLEDLSTKSGISVAELNRIVVTHYTDPLTPPQTKTECSHVHKLLPGVKFCTAWATYTRVMNCEWYIDAPVSSSVQFRVEEAQDAYEKFAADLVVWTKNYITKFVIQKALEEAGVVSAITGLLSYGTAAAPAFITTFKASVDWRMVLFFIDLADFIDKNGKNFENLTNKSFPLIKAGDLKQSCGFSDWKIL